jgi:hypothetical protein
MSLKLLRVGVTVQSSEKKNTPAIGGCITTTKTGLPINQGVVPDTCYTLIGPAQFGKWPFVSY